MSKSIELPYNLPLNVILKMSSTPGPMAAAGLAHQEHHHISTSHSNGSDGGTRHKSRSSRRSKLPSAISMDQHDHHKHRAPNISKQSSSYHQSRSDERDYPPVPAPGAQGSSASMSRTSSRNNAGSRGESLTRHNSGGSIRGSSGSQLGRSNSGSNYANHSGSSKQRTGSNGSSTPPSRAGMGSPTSISSRSERLKRRTASGNGGGDESPQRNLSPAGSKAHFDMKHMHRSIDAVVEEVRDSSAPSGLRSPIEKQLLMQQVIAPAPDPTNAFSPNGLAVAMGATRANSSDPKKERYRSLWGKVGKQAPVLQPTSVSDAVGESGPNTPTGSGPNPKKKWDMVLNPLVQRQKEKGGKKLSRKSSQLDATANYLLHQAEQQHHHQQQQQQQHYMQQAMAQQINSMNAPNQSTTQCDCGDDSCPFCNLMLNMEMTDPNMLIYLYSVLSKNQIVTDGNRSLLVETLRSIAEILIWGDQNDSSVFDFFLERNMLSFFLKIMNQKCGSYVCVQLLQTLNILFENIRNETSIYYLLSNNHVNAIIVHKFDFSDEEVMAYYISFLKTLSFRLNKHTIHFFYNEHTNDFPLYTEAIKFFNHSESMVRIAVRTLTLNVYRTEEESMLKFVIDKTAVPYFSNLVWFIGNHILDMDACVREDTDHRSLGRLKDLAAEHLDHLHYLNDILCLHIEPLNAVLTDHLLKRLLIPLYIFSLGRRSQKDGNKKSEDMKPHVSRISALFLLCQIFLIVTHKPLVRVLAWIIFCGNTDIFTEKGAAKVSLYSQGKSVLMKPRFAAPHVTLEKSLKEEIERTYEETNDDESTTSGSLYEDSLGLPDLPVPTMTCRENPHNLSITDEEKEKRLQESGQIGTSAGENVSEVPENAESQASGESRQDFSLENRPFLECIFQVMSCEENDYMALFGLCLLYAIQQNAGIGSELLEGVFIPSPQGESKGFYNVKLMEKLLHILLASCQYGSKIRLITLEIATMLIKSLVINPEGKSFLSDTHFAQIEGIREESTLLLRNYYKSEEIFLDMFEDEYRAVMKPPTRIDYVMSDACLLLPPTGTPLSGIDFTKRLPCGEVERARRSIRTFFFLRRLSLQVQGLKEDKLPLSNTDSLIQVQDVLDLNNSDLVAVNVTNRDNTKQRRYLVVDVYQIILVEPDFSRLGWGVATFAGFLQDLDVLTDKDDSRCLHVTVHRPGGSGISAGSRLPLLSASFTFDDHIRCMAARQRLTKGRTKARQRKMHQIAQLLELPGNVGPSCPSPPSLNLHALRKEAAAQRRGRSSSGVSSGHSSPRNGPGTGTTSSPAYRPLFSMAGKVPGAAALLREQPLSAAEQQSIDPQALNRSTTATATTAAVGVSGINEPSRTRSSSRPRKSSSREGAGLGAIPRETSRRSHPSRRSSSSATSCRESNCHHEKESVALTEYRTSTTNRGNAPTQPPSSPRGDGSPHSTSLSTPKKSISGQEHTNL